jgi:hypothetical protein
MEVSVHHGLARSGAVIRSKVEAGDCLISISQFNWKPLGERPKPVHLGLEQFIRIGDVPPLAT